MPFPDVEDLRAAVASGAGDDVVNLKALRARWHPDRFTQKLGLRIAADERDAVLAAVTQLAAALNAIA